jgi:hypothetical protein
LEDKVMINDIIKEIGVNNISDVEDDDYVEDPMLENNLLDEDNNNSSYNNEGEGEVDDTGSGTIGGIATRLSVNVSENLG